MDRIIKCECGKTIFNGLILKSVAVAQFAGGIVNIRCRTCKRWLNGIDQKIFLTKEK